MGDRANIAIRTDGTAGAGGPGIVIYSHWGGHRVPFSLSSALRFGRGANDPAYMARSIVSRVIGDGYAAGDLAIVDGEAGYGLTGGMLDAPVSCSGDGYPLIGTDGHSVYLADEDAPAAWLCSVPVAEYIERVPGLAGAPKDGNDFPVFWDWPFPLPWDCCSTAERMLHVADLGAADGLMRRLGI